PAARSGSTSPRGAFRKTYGMPRTWHGVRARTRPSNPVPTAAVGADGQAPWPCKRARSGSGAGRLVSEARRAVSLRACRSPSGPWGSRSCSRQRVEALEPGAIFDPELKLLEALHELPAEARFEGEQWVL